MISTSIGETFVQISMVCPGYEARVATNIWSSMRVGFKKGLVTQLEERTPDQRTCLRDGLGLPTLCLKVGLLHLSVASTIRSGFKVLQPA